MFKYILINVFYTLVKYIISILKWIVIIIIIIAHCIIILYHMLEFIYLVYKNQFCNSISFFLSLNLWFKNEIARLFFILLPNVFNLFSLIMV